MERNCVRTAYRTSLTTTLNTKIGGGGGDDSAAKSERNKVCKGREDEEYHLINGISWPPRSYTCNFCKREFRSAQALGGHMNVHRRDRALLYSPQSTTDAHFTNLNLNLNHNPNPNLPSRGDRKANLDLKLEINEIVIKPNVFERSAYNWNKPEKFIGLEIESKKDIDLELRLGFSA